MYMQKVINIINSFFNRQIVYKYESIMAIIPINYKP